MADKIIWIISSWGCALLFVCIGLYAKHRKKPMWFWSGTTVPEESVSDIPSYNQANCRMWCIYSFPFWIFGISYFIFPIITVILFSIWCTGGIGWLIWYYHQIEKKFIKK